MVQTGRNHAFVGSILHGTVANTLACIPMCPVVVYKYNHRARATGLSDPCKLGCEYPRVPTKPTGRIKRGSPVSFLFREDTIHRSSTGAGLKCPLYIFSVLPSQGDRRRMACRRTVCHPTALPPLSSRSGTDMSRRSCSSLECAVEPSALRQTALSRKSTSRNTGVDA